ncbi:MAG: membrane protease subunit (stomatin/prohibitin family) [Bacteriovoracaceae bacterium]|jgi:membrane protease subunit (stomatin/prohibitin family)
MGIFDAFKKQFIDVIEWSEDDSGLIQYRYPFIDKEIQYGGQLTVSEGQVALFVNEGKVADLFEPGLHKLMTNNLPILTSLMNWDKAFESPFKSDVYYFVTRDQIDQRWGTPNPITIRDKEFGHIRLRANGTYTFKLDDARLFFEKVSGTRGEYRIDELNDQLRSNILTSISSFFGKADIPFLDMAANQVEFSKAIQGAVEAEFTAYGLKLQSFNVQNLSLPEELQDYLDKKSKMNMIGDLNKYAQFETADNIGTAAANEGGGAGMGVGLGAGISMGQTMMNSMGNASGQNSNPVNESATEEEILSTIEKLHGLKEKGILTEEEFNTKKSELLKKLI